MSHPPGSSRRARLTLVHPQAVATAAPVTPPPESAPAARDSSPETEEQA